MKQNPLQSKASSPFHLSCNLRLHRLALAVGLLVLGGWCQQPVQAQLLYLDFNAVGQFANNFNIFGTSNWAEQDGIGVGGSRAIAVTANNDSTITYKTSAWDLSANAAVMIVSVYVKANSLANTGDKIQLGIINVNNNGLNNTAGVAFDTFRTIPNSALSWSLRRQNKTAAGATVETTYGNLGVAAGHWYRFATYFTNQGGGNIGASCSVVDYGSDGLTPGAELVNFATYASQNVGLTTVYPALRAFNDAGLDAFDNWRVGPPIGIPDGVTALATNAKVRISWNATSDGTNYVVQRATVSGGPYTALSTNSSTQFVDTAVVNGTQYFYVVAGQSAVGQGMNSLEVSAIPLAAPATPTNLVAANFDTKVGLTWNASLNASNYYIKRAYASGGPYTSIATNGPSTTFSDTGVTNGQTYYYVISAANVGGESPNSTQVVGKPNTAPTLLVAIGTNNDISLQWIAVRRASSNFVYRSAFSGGPYTRIAMVPGGQTWYDDTPMPDGAIWYYVVSALASGVETAYSPEAVASTPIKAPTGQSAAGVSLTEIDVAWNPVAIGATAYAIERSTDGVNFAAVGTNNNTTFADTGLPAATAYYYRVRASNGITNSPYAGTNWAVTWAAVVRINFGTNSPTDFYPGYLQDNGWAFGDRSNGFSYGWTVPTTNQARERFSALSADKRYDSLIQTMGPSPDGPAGWSLALPNANYRVHLVGGDPSDTTADLQFSVNGWTTDLFVHDGTTHWKEWTNNVTVTNGRLILTNGPAASNNKLCYLDVDGPPLPLHVVSQPTNVFGDELTTTTIGPLLVAGSGPLWYRWLYNTNILLSGQTNNTLILSDTPMSAAGFYQLAASNVMGCVTSSPIRLIMRPDIAGPNLVSAAADQTMTRAFVVFSERVTTSTAQDVVNNFLAANVATGEMLPLTSATLMADLRTVVLATGPQSPGALYVIQVNNVTDISPQANPIAADTQIRFQAWVEVPYFELTELFTNIPNSDVPSLTNTAKFQYGFPDLRYYQTNFYYNSAAMPTGNLDNYGSRSSGFFAAPSSGLYRFFLASDDASELYLNASSVGSTNPAGKVLIASLAAYRTYYTNNDASMSASYFLNVGQKYYIEALQKEGGGGDHIAVAFRIVPDDLTIPDPPPGTAGGTPNIETIGTAFLSTYSDPTAATLVVSGALPSALSVTEDDFVTLQCSASVIPSNTPISFVWQRYDPANTIWTNLPGAVGSLYSFYASLAEQQARIRLTISTVGHVTNFVTALTVSPDRAAPVLVFAGCLDGTHILARFNERVLPQYAGDTFNWQVNGGAAQVIAANLRTNRVAGTERDYLAQVILTLASPISGPFWVDAYGQYDWSANMNGGDSRITGTVQPFATQDIGTPGSDPLAPGGAYPWLANGLDVAAGGSDIWNTTDGMYYVYRAVSGNFDVKVRVNSLAKADVWSKAGLMARPSTNGNSQNITLLATPSDGQNTYTFQWRDTNGGASGNVAGGVPAYTNAWVRLKRTGPVLSSFVSADGANWTSFTNRDTSLFGGAYPATNLWVGLAVTAHNNGGVNNMALAEFRDLYFPLPPTITVQPSPASQTILAHTPVTYSVTANSPSSAGPVIYQWRKDGLDLPGATAPILSLTDPLDTSSGVYSVSVGNDGGAVFSTGASLTVTNAGGGGGTGAKVMDFGMKNGHFWMKFSGMAGATYRTLTTTNIANGPWVEVPPPTLADPNGLFEVTDTASGHSPAEPQRYYKLVTP